MALTQTQNMDSRGGIHNRGQGCNKAQRDFGSGPSIFSSRMKRSIHAVMLLGLASTLFSGLAQESPVPKPPSVATAPPAPTAQAPQPESKVPAAETKAADSETSAESTAEAQGDVISLVDTPLLDAINNLSRNAGLNLLLDPKVTTPVVGPDGKPIPLPNITIRFENVSAKQALEAVLANHDLILVEDQKTGIHRVTKKDPTLREPLITTVYQLKYSNPTNLAMVVTTAVPAGAKVYAEPRTSQMIVTATARDTTEITNLLAKLDVANHQVLIEAQFFETIRSPKSIKGIDWSGTLAAQNISMGNGLTTGSSTTTSPGESTTTTLPSGRTITSTADASTASAVTTAIGDRNVPGMSFNTATGLTPGLAFLNADGVKATLSFLNTDSESESIASPTTVALEGQQTKLVVVRNIPVFEEQQGQISGSGGQSPTSVKPNYDLTVKGEERPLNEVGIKLLVTPRVVADVNVLLDLQPEISNVEAVPERKTLGGRVNESPIFSRRSMSTRAVVPTGNTLVIGGLTSDESTKNFSKIPVLGDIPMLGRLFRKDEKIRNRRNILIFVTPTIIQDADFQANSDPKAFLRNKKEDKLPDDSTRWDSAKPYKSKKTNK